MAQLLREALARTRNKILKKIFDRDLTRQLLRYLLRSGQLVPGLLQDQQHFILKQAVFKKNTQLPAGLNFLEFPSQSLIHWNIAQHCCCGRCARLLTCLCTTITSRECVGVGVGVTQPSVVAQQQFSRIPTECVVSCLHDIIFSSYWHTLKYWNDLVFWQHSSCTILLQFEARTSPPVNSCLLPSASPGFYLSGCLPNVVF